MGSLDPNRCLRRGLRFCRRGEVQRIGCRGEYSVTQMSVHSVRRLWNGASRQ